MASRQSAALVAGYLYSNACVWHCILTPAFIFSPERSYYKEVELTSAVQALRLGRLCRILEQNACFKGKQDGKCSQQSKRQKDKPRKRQKEMEILVIETRARPIAFRDAKDAIYH